MKSVEVENRLQSVRESKKIVKERPFVRGMIKLPHGGRHLPEKYESKFGFFVYCPYTEESWFTFNAEALRNNFLYTGDLEIVELGEKTLCEVWMQYNELLIPGKQVSTKCYILEDPADEKYEVYSDPAYPELAYSETVPKGMLVHKYANRFERDIAIRELEAKYTSGKKALSQLPTKKYLKDEAIIVSDGAKKDSNAVNAVIYLDENSIVKFAEVKKPSDTRNAVIIGEINGAVNAFSLCKLRNKKIITYYYDNTSLLSIYKSKSLSNIPEVQKFKEILEDLEATGTYINFVSIHPKADVIDENENKALLYLHSLCDRECTELDRLFSKSYKNKALYGRREGSSLHDLQGGNRYASKRR